MKLIKQLEEIYEMLVGDNGINRFTHEEIIDRIKQMHDNIPFDYTCPECGGDVCSDPNDSEDINGSVEWEWLCSECDASIMTKDVTMITNVTAEK